MWWVFGAVSDVEVFFFLTVILVQYVNCPSCSLFWFNVPGQTTHSACIMWMHLQQTHLNPEDEGSMFLQSTGVHVQYIMVAETRKSHSVQSTCENM
jgi:hypothetical protein